MRADLRRRRREHLRQRWNHGDERDGSKWEFGWRRHWSPVVMRTTTTEVKTMNQTWIENGGRALKVRSENLAREKKKYTEGKGVW